MVAVRRRPAALLDGRSISPGDGAALFSAPPRGRRAASAACCASASNAVARPARCGHERPRCAPTPPPEPPSWQRRARPVAARPAPGRPRPQRRPAPRPEPAHLRLRRLGPSLACALGERCRRPVRAPPRPASPAPPPNPRGDATTATTAAGRPPRWRRPRPVARNSSSSSTTFRTGARAAVGQLLELQERPQGRGRRDRRPLPGADHGEDERDLQPRSEHIVGHAHPVIVPTALSRARTSGRGRGTAILAWIEHLFATVAARAAVLRRSRDPAGRGHLRRRRPGDHGRLAGGACHHRDRRGQGPGRRVPGDLPHARQPRLGHPAGDHRPHRDHRGDGGARAPRVARRAAGARRVPGRHRHRRPQHPLRPRASSTPRFGRDGWPRLANPVVDTVALARRLVRDEVPNCRLGTLADRFRLDHQSVATAPSTTPWPPPICCTCCWSGRRAWGVLGLDDLLVLPRLGGHPQVAKLRLTTDAAPLARRLLVRRRAGRPPLRGEGHQPAPAGPLVLLRRRPPQGRQPPAGDGRRAPPRGHAPPSRPPSSRPVSSTASNLATTAREPVGGAARLRRPHARPSGSRG